jgi:hypothetical protein
MGNPLTDINPHKRLQTAFDSYVSFEEGGEIRPAFDKC